jgi:pyruvate,orthophosphate dikinase
MAKKYIYKYTEGDGKNKMLLGGKGANLCEMTQIGLRVPPGFVISTEACLGLHQRQQSPARWVMDDVRAHMAWLEQETGKQFGGAGKSAAGFGAFRLRPCPCRA